MWRTDCLKLRQKVGKRCQTPWVWDIPEDQAERVWALACLYTCSYKRLWLFVWVNLSYCCALWHPGLCLSVCVSWAETGEESECGVLCLCVLPSVWFDGGVETPRANGDTAVVICLSGILRVVHKEERMKEEENNTIKSCWGDIPGFLSSFAKSANFAFTSFWVCGVCTCVCAMLWIIIMLL